MQNTLNVNFEHVANNFSLYHFSLYSLIILFIVYHVVKDIIYFKYNDH